MRRWTCCLAFLKVFFGGGWSLCTSLSVVARSCVYVCVCEWGRSANATHQCPAPTQVGGVLVVGFSARALSLGVTPTQVGGVCVCVCGQVSRARMLASTSFFSSSSGGGGREGREGRRGGGGGAHDMPVAHNKKKKKDYRDSLVHGWF